MSKGDMLKASEEAWKRVLEFLMKQPIAITHGVKGLFRVGNGAHVGELMKGLKGYGLALTKFQARAFFDDCDANRDGVVTLTEFNDALRLAKKRKDEESRFEMISAAAWGRVLKFLTSQSIEVTKKLKDMFAAADTDNNGSLDISELMEGMSSLGVVMSAPQARALHKSCDANGDGFVTLQGKFIAASLPPLTSPPSRQGKFIAASLPPLTSPPSRSS
jgi:Ca2+-binding EF-hand superfamily protein